jgi:hypothetical protein
LLEGQFGAWVPVGGTDFEGDVLFYGLGASYFLYGAPYYYGGTGFRLAPVVEGIGWTVLNGKETAALPGNVFQIKAAGGDSIFNMKFGVRVGYQNASLYVGYGHALTGAVWYEEIVRVEFRLIF